jgi:hypothetical protein
MRKVFPCCLLFLFFAVMNTLIAQPNLVLSKTGKTRHFFYQVGDRISYRDKLSDRRISGTIMIMTDSTIELAQAPHIHIDNISIVYRNRHFFSQAAGAGVVILGVYIPISILNRLLQDEHPVINDDILYVNGPMLAVSGISMLLVTRKFRINPWKLQVLDFGRPIYD